MAPSITVLLTCAVLFQPNTLTATQVAVRHDEGLMHGFLALRTLTGKKIADGEMTQVAKGDRLKDRLTFRFKDGSLYEETTLFSQRGSFRLLSDYLVERGPSFKRPMASSINASTGHVTVHYTDGGKEKILNDRLKLPPDVANGMLLTLVKHIEPSAPRTIVSMVATTPKPRLVKLVIVPHGEQAISTGSTQHKAIRYVVKVKIGGLAGLVAPLVGKQPPDVQIWVLNGEAPAFVRFEGPLYDDGPIWRIELALPASF